MYLIDEKYRFPLIVEKTAFTGFIDHFANILDARIDGAEIVKRTIHLLRNDVGQGCFSGSGRTPKDH
jgi:hypothetical protein